MGFVLDEGQASVNDEFRVFYADRSPWHLIIKAKGQPGHGSRMYDNGAMENLMKSVEVISRFRENQFDVVKAGKAAISEVISVNPVYLKSGIPSSNVSVLRLYLFFIGSISHFALYMCLCLCLHLCFVDDNEIVCPGICDEYATFGGRSRV